MAISDLQLALIGLGAAAVSAVWGYNKWQERGHRRLAERLLKGSDADPLLGDAAGAGGAGGRIEPAAAPLATAEDADAVAAGALAVAADASGVPGAIDSPWADPVADAVARIEFPEAIPAPALWAAQAEWAARLDKPLHWVGFSGGTWQRIDAHDAGRYAAVAAALQLADRRGAASEADIAAFADGVRQVAVQLAGVAAVPEAGETLACARALDEFCAEVDFQLAVNVAAGAAAFAGARLRELAEAAALRLAGDGMFHACDEAGATLYTLGNLGAELFDTDTLATLATQGVTLSLDVPNVADGPAVFDRMVAAATQLAQDLGGTVVDGQRAPLTAAMIEAIRARIGEIQARMAARQIAAGSDRAHRLFS